MDTRKRSRNDANANGGFKKSKPEMESSAIGSKLKPCMKFFSTAGCQFGESCHFLHYVPGGYNVVAKMMNQAPIPGPRSATVGPGRFGRMDPREDPHAMGPGRFGRMDSAVPMRAGGFGTSATTKISVYASLAGAIIGKSGVNSKQISRQTGAKLAIRDHESDANLRNVELEGTFDQIEQASAMVKELIASLGSMGGMPGRRTGMPGGQPPPGNKNNFKSKMCENFTKGSCTFGDRCHFAHGPAELRKQGV